MTDDKAQNPATTSEAYDEMKPLWDKVETVLGGTDAMRRAGERYLPKYEAESGHNYSTRLRRANLYNKTQKTLDAWIGRPFSEPMKISDDMPQVVKDLMADVNLQGDNVTVFGRKWFREGLAKAFAHVVVDMPAATPGQTLADDKARGLRPYWCFVRPENLFFASSVVENGQEYLTHVRILEQTTEKFGFTERKTQQIRVYDRLQSGGTWQVFVSIWQLTNDDKGKTKWIVTQQPTAIDIDFIPIVTFYADRCGLMKGKPPLEDVVDLNITHFQSSADQRNILTVARFPILAGSGIPDNTNDGPIELGPKTTLTTSDPAARWYYVEHSGAAISAGERDLEKLEKQMSEYGAAFLSERPGSETATARALDSAEATTPLEDVSIRFNDAMDMLLYVTGRWMGLENGKAGTVHVPIDLGPEHPDRSDNTLLLEMRKGRDISRETILHEAQRRGTLGEDFDPDENESQLQDEAGSFAGAPIGGPINPLAGSYL